jgi:hypothetical protein
VLPGWALPPLNADDANVFSASECLIHDHIQKYKTGTAELEDLIQEVLHHPDFDVREVDTNMYERLMGCLEAGDIEVIDLWEEGDGNQPVQLLSDLALRSSGSCWQIRDRLGTSTLH